MARGIDGIAVELQSQRDVLAEREPAYARVLDGLKDAVRGELGARLAQAWATREFNAWYERPLLLLAALRYDALREGSAHPLYAALAGKPPRVEAATAEALALAVAPERTRFMQAVRERAVQTNETSRAVAWLWPAHLLSRAGERRALSLVDLGASAGLNLIADELPAAWIDEHGAPIAVAPRPAVSVRLGLDIAPLDVRDRDAATWLRACVWPSDSARQARLEQAIACFQRRAAGPNAPELRACALPDAFAHLDALPSDLVILCAQSIVRDYLPEQDRARYERGMREFLVRRGPRAALWAELELADKGEPLDRAAAITARFVDGGGALRELVLSRTHPHPRQVVVDTAAVAEFEAAFAVR